ncbi:MAG: MBL fold metallo-hydrolase [Bacteriovoracaceae bacterium]|nr:MBL fold metallo-hydrolase [Bacteroidota bacterium]
MELQFLGAARTVTGSMHLLRVNGKQILLDCGMFQGRRAETYERNKHFPFDPSTIDAVVLSHAHIDHAGNLPNLVKNGFSGNIYCTPATADLCRIMLMDSGHIQEKDVEFVNKRRAKKKLSPIDPLYTTEDVEPMLELLVEIPYRTDFEVSDGISGKYFDAGHILGSASVRLAIDEREKKLFYLGFTGDVGRPNLPILKDPEYMGNVSALICESTYGGKLHAPAEESSKQLLEVVRRTMDRGGKIIVPSFSVGRTQDLVYQLNNLKNEGLLPDIPVFVDSPLSMKATEIFRKHPECFDDETNEILKSDDDVFGFERLHFIRDAEESKGLNEKRESCMIIAASGMCEAGRIVHHLNNNVENPNNTVMIVGYQAEHTLGRKIVDRNPEISIFGEVKKLNCEVVVMNSFSAHADNNELLGYMKPFDKSQLKNIFLVHGDLERAERYATSLQEQKFRQIDIPERLQKFEL